MKQPLLDTPISINKDVKSPYWFVSFISADGKQRRRSTKVPVSGGLFRGSMLTAAQAKKRALIEGAAIAQGTAQVYVSHDNRSFVEIAQLMLEGKLGRISTASYKNAGTAYRQFTEWLGARSLEPLRLITRADAKAYIDARRAVVRFETVKKNIQAISGAFAWATDAEMIDRNPFAGAKIPSDTRDEKVVHEAFSLDEMRLLIEKLPDEWSSAVRCCFESFGQRMGDVLSLRWEQFDFDAGVLRFVTGKTARVLMQPMRADFLAWARARYDAAHAIGGDAAIYVHPRLRLMSNPSAEFTQLVRAHGIGLSGVGIGGKRKSWHSKTFHSIRATCATLLQASGVSQGIAMELVGHDSAAVHAAYLRPSVEQLRDAASALPSL